LTNYLKLRRWVDFNIGSAASVNGRLVMVIGVIPMLLTPIFGVWWILPSGTLALVWFGFVFWRASRLFRANLLKGDRQYDRKTKFALSPEYRITQSVTETRKKARVEKRAKLQK